MAKRSTPDLPTLLDRAGMDAWNPTCSKGQQRMEEAEEHRLELPPWFRKKWPSNTLASALADRIDACRPKQPCGSGACPRCMQAAQNQVVKTFDWFLRSYGQGKTIVCVSIALPSASVKLGKLKDFDIANFKRRLHYLLDGAEVGWLIGAIDYSLNEHKDTRYKPHWLPHLHAFTITDDPAELSRALSIRIDECDAIPRPVRVVPWDGKSEALRYAFKFYFERRIGVDDAERHDPKTGKSRKCRVTKSQRLRSAERLELLLHLDEFGIDGRIVTRKSQLRSGLFGPVIIPLRGDDRKAEKDRNAQGSLQMPKRRPIRRK